MQSRVSDLKQNFISVIDPEVDPRWDRFVREHSVGWIYHLSGWKRILESCFSHMKGYYLVRLDGPAGNIVSALPLYNVRSWLTGNRLVSIPFATISNPLIENTDDLSPLLEAALMLSEELRCSQVEIRCMHSYEDLLGEQFGEVSNFRHHYIPLAESPEKLFKKFDRSCIRQRIARAQASGLELYSGELESDLRIFYRLLMKTRKRVGRPCQPYRFLKAVWNEYRPSGRCALLLARKDRTFIGGLLLLKYKERVSAEWAASDDEYRTVSPNHFLFWEAIKTAYSDGFKVFDFGRTSQFNKGLMDFKSRWGTAVSNMYEIVYPKQIVERSSSGEESLLKRI
ncbi:MAG: hypothetical protein A2169_08395, partial [Deltaproteobacteria bacterium RBG_13_47_9]